MSSTATADLVGKTKGTGFRVQVTGFWYEAPEHSVFPEPGTPYPFLASRFSCTMACVRVGVLQTWLSSRYRPFWEAYLKALGVEVVHPAPEAVELPVSPAVQKLISEVTSLRKQGLDYLLLPDLQLGSEIGPGDVVSPWMHDLEAALNRYLPGLPTVLRVPAELSPEVMGLAAELGQTLTRNPMTARRALEQTKNLIRPLVPKVRWAGTRLIGVVAQPQLLDDPQTWSAIEQLLTQHNLNPSKPDVAPAGLREEGEKLGLKLKLATDLEAAGMHRYFSRVGKIKGLLYLHDPDCAPLPAPLRKMLGKNNKPSKLLVQGEDWGEAVAELAQTIED